MAAQPEQSAMLPRLNTANIPSPKADDLLVSPPPAYCPPEGMAGPPFPFLRTASFPIRYGASDAFNTFNAYQTVPENLSPEAQALVDQYTVYFTDLFNTWIGWAKLFWKYGVPVLKWSSLFFVRGIGGWREYFLIGAWFLFWFGPGLYLEIMRQQIADIERFRGENEGWVRLVYQVVFWSAWLVIAIVQWGLMLYITQLSGWWAAGMFAAWIVIFGY